MVMPHSRSSDQTLRCPATTVATGTRKFSVNSSLWASSNATKPTENAAPASRVLWV